MAEFDIGELISPAQVTRQVTENRLKVLIQDNPESLLLSLTSNIFSSIDPNTRFLSAKFLLRNFDRLYTREVVSEESKSNVRSKLLSSLGQEMMKCTSLVVCKLLSRIAQITLYDPSKWPELFRNLFNWLALDSKPYLQEYSLNIFSLLPLYLRDTLRSIFPTFFAMIQRFFVRETLLDLRVAVLHASYKFLTCIKSSEDCDDLEDRCRLSRWLSFMSDTMNMVASSCAEAELQETLHGFLSMQSELTRSIHAEVFVAFGDLIMHIAKLDTIESWTRQLALRIMTIFVMEQKHERKRKSTKGTLKMVAMVADLFHFLMEFLTDFEDDEDPLWYSTTGGDDDDNVDGRMMTNYECALTCIGILKIKLSEEMVDDIVLKVLPKYLSETENRLWQNQHAVLRVLEILFPKLEKFSNHVLEVTIKLVEHTHPRVRWAAMNVLNKFNTHIEHSPEKYFGRVFSPLCKALGDIQVPLTQIHAASALIILYEACTEQFIAPHLDSLLKALLVAIKGAITFAATQPDSPKKVLEVESLTWLEKVENGFIRLICSNSPIVRRSTASAMMELLSSPESLEDAAYLSPLADHIIPCLEIAIQKEEKEEVKVVMQEALKKCKQVVEEK